VGPQSIHANRELAYRIVSPNVRGHGVHPNVVGRVERGEYNPTIMKLTAIARALHMPVRELL
jgi:Helix-turn-helix